MLILQDTIALVKRECPSLASIQSSELSLALHYDGSPSWVQGVLFRALPETWPAAVTHQLPLVHIKHTPLPITASQPFQTQISKIRDDDLMGAFDVEGNNLAWKAQGIAASERTESERAQGIRDIGKSWDALVQAGALQRDPVLDVQGEKMAWKTPGGQADIATQFGASGDFQLGDAWNECIRDAALRSEAVQKEESFGKKWAHLVADGALLGIRY